jgi:DNA-binding MarR family transcriptional regulator
MNVKPSISARAVANITKSDGAERFSRARYFDQVLFRDYVTGSDFLIGKLITGSTAAAVKLVALAISHYANSKRNATYADPLTIAKALGIKRDTVKVAIWLLRAHDHLTTSKRRDGMTDLIPRLRDAEFGAVKSAKCKKVFYQRRAKLIERILFDQGLTAGQRVVMLAVAAMTDPDTGQCKAGQSHIANVIHVGRRTAQNAVPKLAELGYVIRLKTEDGRPEVLAVSDLEGSDLGSNLGSNLGSTEGLMPIPST